MRKDDLLLFGPYRWRVLAVEDHGALIITEEIIALRWYHHAFVDVTWAECALRHYLNHAFCYAFGPAEQATILAVANANPDNPWFGTPGGPTTTDRVFLLSLDEACTYFGDSRAGLATKGRQTWCLDDEHNVTRQATYGAAAHSWRLRSPGYYGRTGASVSAQGGIYVRGNGVHGRPRDGGGLWLREPS
jgi:hypothetical protein